MKNLYIFLIFVAVAFTVIYLSDRRLHVPPEPAAAVPSPVPSPSVSPSLTLSELAKEDESRKLLQRENFLARIESKPSFKKAGIRISLLGGNKDVMLIESPVDPEVMIKLLDNTFYNSKNIGMKEIIFRSDAGKSKVIKLDEVSF